MKITDKRSSAFGPEVRPFAETVPLLIAGATEAQVVRPEDSLLLVFDRALDAERMHDLQWKFAQYHPHMQVFIIDGAKATVIRGETPEPKES